jgi:hypothetical protein
MTRITIFTVAAMFVCGTAVAQPPDCPWRFVTGQWKMTDSNGDEARVDWKITADDALIGVWERDGGKSVELAGWRSDQKTFVTTGYGTNGSYWEVKCDTVTKKMMKGKAVQRLPDGSVRKGPWQITKESDDEMESILWLTVDGKEVTLKASFTRVKK